MDECTRDRGALQLAAGKRLRQPRLEAAEADQILAAAAPAGGMLSLERMLVVAAPATSKQIRARRATALVKQVSVPGPHRPWSVGKKTER